MMKGALSVGRLSHRVSPLQLTSGLTTLGTKKLVNNGVLNVCRLSRRASPSPLVTGLSRRRFGSWPKVYPKRVRVITMVSLCLSWGTDSDDSCNRHAITTYGVLANLVVLYRTYCRVGCDGNSYFLLWKSRRPLLGGSAKVRRPHVSRCTH
jgi:hypothetical protein